MKIFFFIFLIATGTVCKSQELSNTDTYNTTDSVKNLNAKETKKLFRPNDLKINLYGIFMNNYSFFYERTVASRLSVQIGYRYQPYRYLADNRYVLNLSEKGVIPLTYLTFETGNQAFTLGMKYYPGKRKVAKGIYLGFIGRYGQFDVDNMEYIFITKNETVYHVPLVSNIQWIGGGISLGRKTVLWKRISIDTFTGIQYGNLQGDLTSNKDLSDLSYEEANTLNDNIEKLFSFNGKKYLSATITDNGINGKITGPSWGLILGFCMGIVF